MIFPHFNHKRKSKASFLNVETNASLSNLFLVLTILQVQQQTTDTDDFQEASPEEKEALKRKCSMDDALENKICDLYDLYVEVISRLPIPN